MERKYLAVPRDDKDIVQFFRTNYRLPVTELCDMAAERFNFCPYEILSEPEARAHSENRKNLKYRSIDYHMIDERTGTTISSSNPDF